MARADAVERTLGRARSGISGGAERGASLMSASQPKSAKELSAGGGEVGGEKAK